MANETADRWQFSVARMLAATGLIALSLAIWQITPYFTCYLPSLLGICWIGALGVLRSGWSGFKQSLFIGAFIFPIVLAVIVMVLLIVWPSLSEWLGYGFR